LTDFLFGMGTLNTAALRERYEPLAAENLDPGQLLAQLRPEIRSKR